MSNFSTLSIADLDLVTGGENPAPSDIFSGNAGENRTEITGNGAFQTPVGVKVEGGGAYRSAESNEISCIRNLIGAGANPLDAANACRTPPR
jgi:hypothetical protein